jgi:hypothetical protein
MRTVLLLLLAMLAIKTTAVTTASGQDACSKGYTGCVDRCVTRPSQSLQDTCIESCQTQAKACFSSGGPGSNVQTVHEAPKPQNKAADKPERPAAKVAAPEKPAAKMAAPAKPAKPERKPH